MDTGERPGSPAHWDGLLRATVAGVRARSASAVLDDIAAASVAQAHALSSKRLPPDPHRHPAPPKPALDRLRHDHRQLRPYLREWLIAAADHGYRLPAEDLPLLRSLVADDPACAVPAARLAGRAGWDLALGRPGRFDDEPGLFRTGTVEDWCLYLRNLRAHDPDRARELLEAEWWRPWAPGLRRVTARERMALLRIFEVGLSLDDEPFLEALLDDRIKLPRSTAAGLLAALPGSAYGERMARRVFACVRADRDQFVVTGQIERTADALRDKVEALKQVSHTTGPDFDTANGDLVNALSATPLAAWARQFGLSRREILQRVLESETVIVHGFVLAILRQRDAGWAATALCFELRPEDMTCVMAPEDLDDAPSAAGPRYPWSPLLAEFPVPWPAGPAHRLWGEVEGTVSHGYTWGRSLDHMSRGLPVSIEKDMRELMSRVGETSEAGRRVRQLLDALTHRRMLLDELAGGRE